MREQVLGRLVRVLQERVGLDAAQAEQVAQGVADFVQQHAGELLKMATGDGGVQDRSGESWGADRDSPRAQKNERGRTIPSPLPYVCLRMMGRYCGS